ncbi:uncharacterized protein HGUI_02763 [Hanseniaspora guilliermondii]|uniref:C2H2-type domain-containing protein n=1 Tax=Hanseniaspora guilliermondii TaxID=56406 RepID=A0A1L0B682_9ASCO|nr:uncharacterized protein HGUI_02763 [Hanseniaspora guilliermondii]
MNTKNHQDSKGTKKGSIQDLNMQMNSMNSEHSMDKNNRNPRVILNSSTLHTSPNQYMNVQQAYPFNTVYTQPFMNSPEVINQNVPFNRNTAPLYTNFVGNYYPMVPSLNLNMNQSISYYNDNNQYVPYRNSQPLIYMGPDGNFYQVYNNSMINSGRDVTFPNTLQNITNMRADNTTISNPQLTKQRSYSSPSIYNRQDLPKLNFKLPDLKTHLNSYTNKEQKPKLPSLKELKQKINGTSTDTKKVTKPSSKKTSRPLKFPCTQCDKKFHRQDALQTHMNIHLGLKPYKCDICGKCFNAKQNMVRHKKTHQR